MNKLLTLWRWLRSLPTLAYSIASVVTLGCILYAYHTHATNAAFARGQADVTERANALSDTVARLRADTVSKQARQRTDSVRTVITWRVAQVDSAAIAAVALAQQLPPEIDTIPAVVELKQAVLTLGARVTELVTANTDFTVTLADERSAHTAQVSFLTRDLTASQQREIGLADALTKRPRWRTVVKGVVYGAVAGAGTLYGVQRVTK